jgi:Xaa-Pro aminopeptidase
MKKIKANEPVMVDFGITYFGYQVDSTRMYCIGTPNDEFNYFYEKALSIEKTTVNMLKRDSITSEIFNMAFEKAKELKVCNEFLGIKKNKKKFIGHGVGLETTELPLIAKNFNEKILNGMTIAIEPKFVIENLGIVGVENTNLVTSEGVIVLTDFENNILIC